MTQSAKLMQDDKHRSLILVSYGEDPIEDQRQHGPECNARDVHPRDRQALGA